MKTPYVPMSQPWLYSAVALLLLAESASAQNAAFKLGSAYNGVPTAFAGVTYPADRIVIYDLPATGPYAAVAERPDGYLDLIATVSGGGSSMPRATGRSWSSPQAAPAWNLTRTTSSARPAIWVP